MERLLIDLQSFLSFQIDADIDAIIQQGEERTAELNSKYEGLNFDDLNNFKSDSMLQWEGEDFKNGVRGFRNTSLTEVAELIVSSYK